MFQNLQFIATATLLLPLFGCSQADQDTNETSQANVKTGKQAPSTNGHSEDELEDASPPGKDKNQLATVESAGRSLTEWVLEKGGTVSAYVGGKQMSWDREVELPDANIEPFRIKLEGAVISDEEMKKFAGHLRLRDLCLNQSTVTDNGLKHLRDLPELESLQLGNTQITDEGVAYFAQIPSVQQLYLHSTKIGDKGLKRITTLPGITVLWLADTKITNAGLVHVGQIQSLVRLNLQNTSVTDEGLDELSRLQSLNSCDVRNTNVTRSAAEALDEQLKNGTVVYE